MAGAGIEVAIKADPVPPVGGLSSVARVKRMNVPQVAGERRNGKQRAESL